MIPRGAVWTAVAGVLPFFFGAATAVLIPVRTRAGMGWLDLFLGDLFLIAYGVAALTFLSGALWGFAAERQPDEGDTGWFPVLALLPGAWAFAAWSLVDPFWLLVALMAGFGAALWLDRTFAHRGLAPDWWFRLQVPLKSAVIVCLGVTAVT